MAGVEVIVDSRGRKVVVTPSLEGTRGAEPRDRIGAAYRRQALGEKVSDPVLHKLRRRFLNQPRTALGF